MSSPDPRRWVLACEPGALESLAPLVSAHATRREVSVSTAPIPGDRRGWERLLGRDAGAVLVVGPYRRSAGRMLPGVLLRDRDGRPVPVGWVPAVRELDAFTAAAVDVLSREETDAPVAVLGQVSARYRHLADRLEHHLDGVPTVRWGAERVTREDMLTGVTAGLGLAIYLGHGRPSGWAAYRGLRGPDLAPVAERPLGCLMSVTCWTASRRGVGVSFAERVVLLGAAVSSLGAIRPVLHLDSTRVVVAIAHALVRRPASVEALITDTFTDAAGDPTPEAFAYRLCGDPAASLASAAGAAKRASDVFAPAPDFVPLGARRVPA